MSLAIERAENKTETMRARAGAIDELVELGVLDDHSGSNDPLSRELAQLTSQHNVETELAAMRGELSIEAPSQSSSSVDAELAVLRGELPPSKTRKALGEG